MPRLRTILFDFMGTCLDWHTSVVSSLPLAMPASLRSAFALTWREAYFASNAARQSSGKPPEDIDVTHWNTLLSLVSPGGEFAQYKPLFTADVMENCIAAWHSQRAWADVAPALHALRELGYEVVVHANGTVRYQLDLCRSSGLRFDMLFSSELMGCYKPAPDAYKRALRLLKREVSEVVMVAAHASDTAGAKACGIRTVYIQRWSDDIYEDQDVVKKANDRWIVGMQDLVDAIKSLDK